MMHSINRKTMLTSNQHNQFVVTRKNRSESDFILVVFFFCLFKQQCGWLSKTLSFFILSYCFFCSVSLVTSVSLVLCHSPSFSLLYDLGYSVFIAEHWDQRKKKKKKKRKKNQKVKSMKDILVEMCNLLLLCKLPTRCAQTQSRAVALSSAQQGCGHDM